MSRRALTGLMALAVAVGPVWAEWTDPEVAEVGDATVRQNLERTVWSQFERDVAALQAQVAGLDQAQRRASVQCDVKPKLRGIIGFRSEQEGADCRLKDGGPISQIQAAARSLFSDERFEPLAESRRQHFMPSSGGYWYAGAGMETAPTHYYTYQPSGVFSKLQQAESYGTIPSERIWKDDVVGSGVALPASGYQDRYLGGRSAQGFLQRMNTELAAAAEAVRSYRTQNREVAQTIAGILQQDNATAAAEGRGPYWDIGGESRFPHADLAGMHPNYASLTLPGDDEAHPATVARIQNGYVWFTKFGVAALAGEGPSSQPADETDPPEPEVTSTDLSTGDGTEIETTTAPGVGDTTGPYGLPEEGTGEDAVTGEEADEPQPTAEVLGSNYRRAEAFQNSQNLYAGLLPLYTSGMWQEGMTPENQAARELAARSLAREVNFMGLGLDASDPSRPRSGWDHGDALPAGVELEDVEEQREALLLTIFALEPAALNESLHLSGLSAMANVDEMVGAFYGDSQTVGELYDHIGNRVRPATTHHRARVDGAAARLPEDTRQKIDAELQAYREAHDAYEAALDDLARFEGVNPLTGGSEPLPRDQLAAKAGAAAERLAVLRTAAAALSQAAQDAAAGQPEQGGSK